MNNRLTAQAAAAACIKQMEALELPVHSFLLYRDGKTAVEAYFAPYGRESLHRMYSVTKSFVSLAVGLLADKGMVSLEDPVVKYFEEYLPEDIHPWLAEMTLKDMLKMETCYGSTTYKKDLTKNWVESFFTTEPDRRPGRIFQYDTSAAHTLCALVEKLTGMELLDFLRKECLDEMGFSPDAYIIKDPFGVSMGGSGLMARPSDLLKVGILLLNGGCWNGKQIYPEWYIKEAASCQVLTGISRHNQDERQGYGYQFWQFRNGGFGCYGMGGQYVLCFPKYRAVCVTTADTLGINGGQQQILDCIYSYIMPWLEEEPEEETLPVVFEGLTQKPAAHEADGALLERLACGGQRRYRSLTADAWFQEIGIEISADKTGGSFWYRCPEGEGRLSFSLGGWQETVFPFYGQTCAVSAGFARENDLMIRAQITGEDSSSVCIHLAFREESLSAFFTSTGENKFLEFRGFFEGKIVC